MIKKRSIVSYEKLSIDQKKQLLLAFPNGFNEGMTQIKTPTGETQDALLWETDDIIYLVKINKPMIKAKSIDDEDDEDEIIPKEDEVKIEDEEDEFADDDIEDEYDVADEDDGEEEEDDK